MNDESEKEVNDLMRGFIAEADFYDQVGHSTMAAHDTPTGLDLQSLTLDEWECVTVDDSEDLPSPTHVISDPKLH